MCKKMNPHFSIFYCRLLGQLSICCFDARIHLISEKMGEICLKIDQHSFREEFLIGAQYKQGRSQPPQVGGAKLKKKNFGGQN
jgi:hypothetical protein